MELIAINFVLEFARDVQNLLESLDKEYGNLLVNGSAYYKKRIQTRASELTKELYEKYKEVLDLKLEQGEEGSNIVLTYKNQKILVPRYYFIKAKFYSLKESLDNIILLHEYDVLEWDDFKFKLINTFYFEDESSKLINFNTLEKMRFFLGLISKFPNFDFENLPPQLDTILYQPLYKKYRKKFTLSRYYKSLVKPDAYLFSHHINVIPIPNYKVWNLNLVYFTLSDFESLRYKQKISYFPIQVFEDKTGNPFSIIALIPSDSLSNEIKSCKIQKYSIIYNFENFKIQKKKVVSFYPIHNSIFDAYVNYFDEIDSITESSTKKINTYEYIIDFSTNEDLPGSLKQYLRKEQLTYFNLFYGEGGNQFKRNYSSNENLKRKAYQNLFHRRYTFPDFNYKERFLLVLKKKRNKTFLNFSNFLKNWTYQTIVYELKDKIIYYGFLLPRFNFATETVLIDELFKKLGLEYEIYFNKYEINQSNLSLYTLPSSDQFNESEFTWKLKEIKFPITIKEKESFINLQIYNEKKNLNKS